MVDIVLTYLFHLPSETFLITHIKAYLNEQTVRGLFRNLVTAMEYIHSKGIVHCDISLENVLLASEDDITSIRIVDFEFARYSRAQHTYYYGRNPMYMAPEIINHERHGKVRIERGRGRWHAFVIWYGNERFT